MIAPRLIGWLPLRGLPNSADDAFNLLPKEYCRRAYPCFAHAYRAPAIHSAARRTLSRQGLGTGPGFLGTHSLFSSPRLVRHLPSRLLRPGG